MLDRTNTPPLREVARLILYRLPALIAKREAARGTDQYELAHIAVDNARGNICEVAGGYWLSHESGFRFSAFGVAGPTRPSRAEAMVAWAHAVLGGERRMNEPEKIWLLWRDGQGPTGRLVASEIDHSDEGFPEYVRVDLLDAANAKIKRLRALLREGE